MKKLYILFLLTIVTGCQSDIHETGAGSFEGIYIATNLDLWLGEDGTLQNEDGVKFKQGNYYEAIRKTVAQRGMHFGVTLYLENEETFKYLGNIIKAFSANVEVYRIHQPPPPIK